VGLVAMCELELAVLATAPGLCWKPESPWRQVACVMPCSAMSRFGLPHRGWGLFLQRDDIRRVHRGSSDAGRQSRRQLDYRYRLSASCKVLALVSFFKSAFLRDTDPEIRVPTFSSFTARACTFKC